MDGEQTPVRVLVVAGDDGSAEICRALADGPFEIVVDRAAASELDVCLVDVGIGQHWRDLVAELAHALPTAPTVVFAATEEELLEALRAGAVGYLPKSMNPERLGAALLGVLRGEAALPRTLVARLIDEFQMSERRRRLPLLGGRRVSLTPREWQILERLRDGHSTKEIALELYVAEVTVRSHVGAILRKLSVRTRREALALLQDE